MRGDDLLLLHLALLDEPREQVDEEPPLPAARERLDSELGAEAAARLVASLVRV